MFGHHKAKREKKKSKREKESFTQEKQNWEKNAPAREKEASDFRNQQVGEKTAQSKAERDKATQEGRADLESFLAKEVQGMDPAKRQALQYEANKGVQRTHQAANRQLLGDQAQRGIQGKGGVGYAQQRDLQKMANEAYGGVERDLTKLDRDLALKKQAAIFTGGQGNAAQSQLDKQLAIDELELADEKKRQRNFEDQFHKQYQQFTRA